MVASLTGDDWLEFLDETGVTYLFTQGNGRLLNDCSYQSATQLAQFTRKEVAELQEAVFFWIRKHQNLSQAMDSAKL